MLLAACRPPAYVQPRPDEPHAILKIRHVVHAKRGPFYGAGTMLGEFSIDERTLETQDTSGTFHVRVRPEVAQFQVHGHSYHYEMQRQMRTRQVPEYYSCPQQQCTGGYGTSRSCYTSYRQCTRYRSETYYQNVQVQVTDDACGRAFQLAPVAGHMYLVQFDYYSDGECAVRCMEQLPGGSGEFQLAPCPVPPAPPAPTASR